MADITIQQAYALAMGVFVNPYRGGLLDDGDLLGSLDGETKCFANQANFLAVFGTNPTKNRLQRLLDGTAINLPAIPNQSGPTVLDLPNQAYTLVSTSAVLGHNSVTGFETPIFTPQEFINGVRQNYNYRTGANFQPAVVNISATEQLYHLAGLGLFKKLKK